MKYLILSLLFLLTSPVFAYNCPYGYVNAPYPGHCNLYIDQNNDNLCDNSQSEQALKTVFGNTANPEQYTKTNYHIGQIIIMFIIFQLTGISLMQYNKINKLHWRKINNYCLLISFIIVFFTSIIVLLNITNIIQTENLPTINWLHVEVGLVMILFSLEHLIRRWQHFIIKFKKDEHS